MVVEMWEVSPSVHFLGEYKQGYSFGQKKNLWQCLVRVRVFLLHV